VGKEIEMTKEELLAEGALILEQEGWLIGRFAHETKSARLKWFFERYQEWQKKVKQFREQFPGEWQEPPDNS
jgi:hypothetical protein